METRAAPRLKVHRRSVRMDRLEYTVLSPRPTEEARFATNSFHQTWHVITSEEGVALLARLCWAMAFQRRERTIVLLDSPLIVPSPFDADESSPIVVVNNDLGGLSRAAVEDLRMQLPLSAASDGTVVLQTRGLDQALENPTEFRDRNREAQLQDEHQQRRWIDGSNGLVIIAAPPPVLRTWGVDLSGLGSPPPAGEWVGRSIWTTPPRWERSRCSMTSTQCWHGPRQRGPVPFPTQRTGGSQKTNGRRYGPSCQVASVTEFGAAVSTYPERHCIPLRSIAPQVPRGVGCRDEGAETQPLPCDDARLERDDLSYCRHAAVSANADSVRFEGGSTHNLNRPPSPEDGIDVVDGEGDIGSICLVLRHTEGSETDGDRVTSEVVLHRQNRRNCLH